MEYQIEVETRAGRWNITGHVIALRIDLRQRFDLLFPRALSQFEHVLAEQDIDIELEAVTLALVLPDGWEHERALLHLTALDAVPILANIADVRRRLEYPRRPDGSISEHGYHLATEIRARALPPQAPRPVLYHPATVPT